jgi:hypothetical protein
MVEEDADGLWIVDKLAISASEFHRVGYIYFGERWVKRPSYGGSVEDFEKGNEMKEMNEQVEQEIFDAGFEAMAKAMLDILKKFKDYDEGEVMEALIRTSLMFSVHSIVKAGENEEAIHDAVNHMVTAVHLKDALERGKH